ncbi:MAG: hypothetical protein ACRCZM_12060, partial [Bacteroidales bacterium]
MKKIFSLRGGLQLIILLLLLVFVGCKADLSGELLGEKINIQLTLDGQPISKARSLDRLQVRYQIADNSGVILQDIMSDYNPSQNTIVIEP